MSKTCSVLVVEDSPIAQASAVSLLESLGCFVQLAGSGRQAIELAQASVFDLIFMDLGLPDVDVLTVLETIQMHYQAQKKPIPFVIAVTAYHDRNIQARCFEAGMQEFIIKPLTLSKARDILEHYT